MHSSLVRLQNVFGFFTTVAFTVAALIALSDVATTRSPSGSLAIERVQVVRGRPNYYSQQLEEYANIRFSLDADVSSLFNWNTKQVFVYVSAVWPEDGNGTVSDVDLEKGLGQSKGFNEAVIWDAIITSPSSDHLSNMPPVAKRKLIKSAEGKSVDPSRGILKLKNQKPKYQITSPSGKLAQTKDVRLYMHYNVQPWVGILTWTPQMEFGKWKLMKGGVSEVFSLPALKKKENEGAKS